MAVSEVDFTTDNLLVKSYERYSFAHTDLRGLYASFAQTKEMVAAEILNNSFESVATVSLPTAIALGAAAVIIKNPEVSRRGVLGLFSRDLDLDPVAEATPTAEVGRTLDFS